MAAAVQVAPPPSQAEAEASIMIAILNDKREDSMNLLADEYFAGINARDRHGRSLLHLAAAHDMEEVGVIICKMPHFAMANAVDLSSRSALHLAAIHGMEKLAQAILLSPGFDQYNTKDLQMEQTALLWAAKCGHWNVAEVLVLNDSIDLMATDPAGDDVHAMAIEYGHDEIARLVTTQLKLQGMQKAPAAALDAAPDAVPDAAPDAAPDEAPEAAPDAVMDDGYT